RGTDHETYANEAGTFSRVTMGGTYIQAPAGRIEVAPGEIAFASRRGNPGPKLRGPSSSDERRLQTSVDAPAAVSTAAAAPVLPAQAITDTPLKKSVV